MITIEKINEVYIRIYTDPSIAQELSEFFTFEVPGARFTPAFKARIWDGKIRMFDLHRKTLYLGLLKYVQDFAERNNYDITYQNEVTSTTNASIENIREYAEWLNLHGRGEPIKIRDYQLDAIHKAVFAERTVLLSPTASGKSLIIYTTMRYHLEEGRKCILVVPTTSLVEQMYTDFQDYSSANGWRVDRHCQKLYSGFTRDFTSDVLITTWQSIYKQPVTWFNQFDVIFGDEAHNFKAKSLTSIMHKCVNTPYRVGTTGTLDGTKTHKLVLEGLFGPVYKVTSTRELMDANQLAELKIFGIVLDYPDDIKKANKSQTYQEEMDFLVGYEPRNKFIRNLALKQTGNSLVLFQYVEKHGKILHEMINNKDSERKVFFVYGGTDTDQRENIRRITEDETDAIIVASYGTFSTGINIKNLHNIIFASPTKSRIRNLQSIGRGLRRGDEKVSCNLYDIGDDLTWKARKNYTLHHMIDRIKIYNDEHFEYKLLKVPLNVL